MYSEWGTCRKGIETLSHVGAQHEECEPIWSGNAQTHTPSVCPAPANPLALPSLNEIPASLEWKAGMGGKAFSKEILDYLGRAIDAYDSLGLNAVDVSPEECPLQVNNKVVDAVDKRVKQSFGDAPFYYTKNGVAEILWESGMMFYDVDLDYIAEADISKEKRDLLFRLVTLALKVNDVVDLNGYADWCEERLEEYHEWGEEELDEEEELIWLNEGAYSISIADARRDINHFLWREYWYRFIFDLDTDNLEADLERYEGDSQFKEKAMRFVHNSRKIGKLSNYVEETEEGSSYSYLFITPANSDNYVAYAYMSDIHDISMHEMTSPLVNHIPYDDIKSRKNTHSKADMVYNYMEDFLYLLVKATKEDE